MTIPPDKRDHFIAGLTICACAFALQSLFGLVDRWGTPPTVIISFSLGVVVGVGKEVHDHFRPRKHTVEFLDALATIAGSAAVALVILLVERLWAGH